MSAATIVLPVPRGRAFGTSVLASATRFELTPKRCAVVYTTQGRVLWAEKSLSFTGWIPKRSGRRTRPRSTTSSGARATSRAASCLAERDDRRPRESIAPLYTHAYASVKRFVGRLRAKPVVEARPVIETVPGHEAQVDYGEGPMVRDPNTGKYRRTRLFVLTLGFSRKSVRLLAWRSSAQVWSELHEQAFRRLGGAPRIVVLDNLREGVLSPDVYDAALNPLYRDVLAHYGVVALPCRVRDPNRKGKVESGVGHAQRTPLPSAFRFDHHADLIEHALREVRACMRTKSAR